MFREVGCAEEGGVSVLMDECMCRKGVRVSRKIGCVSRKGLGGMRVYDDDVRAPVGGGLYSDTDTNRCHAKKEQL